MTKQKLVYENEQLYKPFDFINKDLDLLFILILIEGYRSGKNEFNFGDFFKGNYWDIDDVKDEIMDTNDYYDVADMVLEQLVFILEDLRMGNVKEVGIDNIDFAIRDLLVEVAKIGKENAEDEAPHYEPSFEQLYFLADQKKKFQEAVLEKNPELIKSKDWIEMRMDKSLFYTRDEGYFRKLQPLIIQLPSHIILRILFDERKVEEVEKEIKKYFQDFSKDKLSEDLRRYQEKRLYFAQQIENFYRYISRLNLIGDVINIPFSILQEKSFEPVKILCLLQVNGIIQMRWSDEGSWKVQFLQTPITPETLLGKKKTIQTEQEDVRLKSGLNYNEATSMLQIGQYEIKVNGPDQKDFLKIIFKDKKQLNKEWFFSEICEIFDREMDNNDKKFYNASYQINLKVAQKTPIKDFLITTKHSVRVNPKYL